MLKHLVPAIALSLFSSAAHASWLVTGSGQWAKPGVPAMGYGDERPESAYTSVGRFTNFLSGATGSYRVTAVGGINYTIDYALDAGGGYRDVATWDPTLPNEFFIQGWGMMFLQP